MSASPEITSAHSAPSSYSPAKILSPRSSCMDKGWTELTATLKKQFPTLNIIGPDIWEKYTHLGLSYADAPTPGDRDFLTSDLTKLSTAELEVDAGISLVMVPKGLSFEKIKTIAGDAKGLIRGCSVKEDPVVERTYWVALTNSVLKGSTHKTPHELKHFVEEKGYQSPDALAVTASAVLTFIHHGQRFYGANLKYLYSHCGPANTGRIVGGFDDSGLLVSDYRPCVTKWKQWNPEEGSPRVYAPSYFQRERKTFGAEGGSKEFVVFTPNFEEIGANGLPKGTGFTPDRYLGTAAQIKIDESRSYGFL